MSELALLALRLGFLLLLWIFIFTIVGSLRRDLVIGRRNKARLANAAEANANRGAPVGAAATAGARGSQYDAAAIAGAGSPASAGVASGAGASGDGAQTGAPAPARAPRLTPKTLVILEGPLKGQEFPLAASPLLLGRAQEASVVLDDDYASGRHARLYPQGSQWFLEDLGSTNGTFVGDERLSRAQRIDPGQLIRIGKTVMELRP